MNWLSQMILTEIDLNKMYPADKPRDCSKPKRETKNQDNFDIASVKRESEITNQVLKALGDSAMTSRQLAIKLGDKNGPVKKVTMNARLHRMMESGYLERTIPPSGQGITWKVIK